MRQLFRFSSNLSLPLFTRYNLHPQIVEILAAKGLHQATAVQDLMFTSEHRNNLLIGPTGSGKTYSYLLPMLGALKKEEEDQKKQLTEKVRVRGVVVVHSKELVEQVCDVSRDFTRPMKLTVKGLGLHMSYMEESRLLKNKGVDIIVTTLDRLKKHRQDQNVYLSKTSHLVVDEVDTLIDSGTEQDLLYLIQYCKQKDPSPFVSFCGATYTAKLERFIKEAYKPDEIKTMIEKNSHMHLENLSHEFVHCMNLDKVEPFNTIYKEIKKTDGSMVIFCNTIPSCHFLQHYFQNEAVKVVTLHSDVPKQVRLQNIAEFRSQNIKILIATDLAARGLDFTFVDKIINFDFPSSTSDYLHRAGRAGRAGKPGFIYSLYHNKDQHLIDELRLANESDRKITIKESAYSRMNRENMTGRRTQTHSKDVSQPQKQRHPSRVKLEGYKPPKSEHKQERTAKKSHKERQWDKIRALKRS